MRVGRVRPEVLAAISKDPAVLQQVRTVADVIRKEARRRAPKVSGNLSKNIDMEKVTVRGLTEYHVGWNKHAYYGSLVEFGTEDTAARPHLRPAADMVGR